METISTVPEVKQEYNMTNAKTYQRKSCEGSIYIIINRDEHGHFKSILINPPSKTNDCGCSYAYSLQDLLTFALLRADGEKDIRLILKAVSGHYCNAMPPNKDHCKSCSDCVAQILKSEFLDEKQKS